MPDMKLFAGNATPELAQRIADRLYISLGDATVSRFSDGEVAVQINENVRGSDVFIIQSTYAPTNDNLMELVVMIDAMRRASAGRITAKVVADFLSNVGVDRVLTIDLHAEQIQGFFDVPLNGTNTLASLTKQVQGKLWQLEYLSYQDIQYQSHTIPLPHKLKLTQGDISINIIISNWNIEQ
ncbi:lipoprotein insertase outer membrane protein LolB [Vibrio pectenicida]|uniref:lipoprotein insertase outer membrane protein LolB n=1 Tax=Vibrio pectenicida TaxID=62763 RepID=UPI003B9A8238